MRVLAKVSISSYNSKLSPGSGPMAPMWEAMGGPVLPKFAMAFAEQLKSRIEEANGGVRPVAARATPFAAFKAWLRKLWASMFGSPVNDERS